MKDIYIIGCGGLAKEIYFLLRTIGGYNLKGFINHEKVDDIIFKTNVVPVILESEFLKFANNNNTNLAIGIGNPKIIMKIIKKFNGFSFPNLIHPSVLADFENNEMGIGNIFAANVIMTTNIKIGNFNIFNWLVSVGHDVLIGDFNVINPSVNISGGVKIGNANLLGVNCTILQYRTIGDGSVIGASSLVTKDVLDSMTVVGVPANVM